MPPRPTTTRGRLSSRQPHPRSIRPSENGLYQDDRLYGGYASFDHDSIDFVSPMPSMSLPPPYEFYDHQINMTSSRPARLDHANGSDTHLARQAHRQSMFGVPQTAWASTSTVDLGGWAQEQRWHEHMGPGSMPPLNHNNACPATQRSHQPWGRIATRLNDVLSGAEGDAGGSEDLDDAMRVLDLDDVEDHAERAGPSSRLAVPGPRPAKERRKSSSNRIINFQKVWQYQNSRLPPGMVPFNVYLPTWTLICRAVQGSMDVYAKPPKNQRHQYFDPDPKQGIKATIIKSQPVDDRKLLIVAVRGSQWKLIDWKANLATSPTPPEGFLDDEGNACHGGFLAVAKAMVPAIAAQLRRLVQEEPEWITSSVLFTGHSAGGAVASLLFSHMLSNQVSELTALTGVFKRVHCVTFGAPPVSLLPLQVPPGRAHQKNQFLSFVNEGDPVVRAEAPYMFSLIKLLAEPAPSASGVSRPNRLRAKLSCQSLKARDSTQDVSAARRRWPVPEATLSTAGSLVLLREKPGGEPDAVEAVRVTDGELRGIIFGDVAKHAMAMYKERLDELAFAAITGRDGG